MTWYLQRAGAMSLITGRYSESGYTEYKDGSKYHWTKIEPIGAMLDFEAAGVINTDLPFQAMRTITGDFFGELLILNL